MIYPTSLSADQWVRGPKRPHLSLLDERFRADWLNAKPFTSNYRLGDRDMISPKWLNGVKFKETGLYVPDMIPGTPDVYPCCEPQIPALRGATGVNDTVTTPTAKETQDLGPEVQNLPFEIVAGTESGIPGYGELMPPWGHARNLSLIDNWLGSVFAEALISNPTPTADEWVDGAEADFTSMSLQTTRTCEAASGVPMVEAFAAVDGLLTDMLGDEQGMIFLAPLAFAWVTLTSGIRLDPEYGHPMSPNGHWVISEPAFSGMPGPGNAAPEEGADFIWGTPMVQWFHTNVYNPGGLDPTLQGHQAEVPLFNTARNRVFTFDELWGILIVRPCSVYAYGGYPREV